MEISKCLIIFDLDDCIIYTNVNDNGKLMHTKRPGLDELIKSLSPSYDFGVWTAGSKEHAHLIVNTLLSEYLDIIKIIW